MITLQPLNDIKVINRVILDAAVNDDISDDASKNHEIQQLPHTFECLGIYQDEEIKGLFMLCLLYTSPSPRDQRGSRMPSSA